jgi:hypothetical protein
MHQKAPNGWVLPVEKGERVHHPQPPPETRRGLFLSQLCFFIKKLRMSKIVPALAPSCFRRGLGVVKPAAVFFR